MKTADVVIVGGGIAGLAAAWCLTRPPGRRVLLLEREELFASHSSGRNAAIFRHLDGTPGGVELAVRSAHLLDELLGERGAWLHRTGALFVGRTEAALARLLALAQAHGIEHALLGREELERRSPALRGGSAMVGLAVPGDGVIDIHRVCTALGDAARAAGARLRLRAEVVRVLAAEGRVTGVELRGGEQVAAGAVLVAGGAWSSGLGESAGAPLPLRPMRRHLALLDVRPGPSPEAPVVWAVDDEAYFRPESGGTLASPCDEDPCEPCLPPESPGARELLAEKLSRLAPALAESGVRRGWGCLRTFAPDRGMVLGADPRVAGLHWLAGLGGHGMTAGVGAAELFARGLEGAATPLLRALRPGRLL